MRELPREIQPTKLFGKQSSHEHLQGLDNEAATTGGDKLCALVGPELWSISPSGTIELICLSSAALLRQASVPSKPSIRSNSGA